MKQFIFWNTVNTIIFCKKKIDKEYVSVQLWGRHQACQGCLLIPDFSGVGEK